MSAASGHQLLSYLPCLMNSFAATCPATIRAASANRGQRPGRQKLRGLASGGAYSLPAAGASCGTRSHPAFWRPCPQRRVSPHAATCSPAASRPTRPRPRDVGRISKERAAIGRRALRPAATAPRPSRCGRPTNVLQAGDPAPNLTARDPDVSRPSGVCPLRWRHCPRCVIPPTHASSFCAAKIL